MNKANFYLEIGVTIAVFLSSILILTIEKDWWGGYLTEKQERGGYWSNFKDVK
jgi:uncharacterized membrane protein YraQ (UPF0718 family)